MEIYERTFPEVTNNMIAKYDDCYLRRECKEGEYTNNLIYLTPDINNNSLRYENGPYWRGLGNYLFWWQIETLFPGYWGKLDNMFRYNNTNDIILTEKQVYFSSIIIGVNMSYYYERYGFRFNSEGCFIYSNTSQKFQEMMQKLVSDKIITNDIIKFWYLDGPSYIYNIDNNKSDSSSCYKNNKNKINIIKVLKKNDGFSLLLPPSACKGHLGYEIYENGKVINFTMDTFFTDIIIYNSNYVPKYKVRAYDKLLEYTDLSDSNSYEIDSQVCIYNGNYYNSIGEAVKTIPTDTTETYEIILIKNIFESNIEINANIIIKLDEKSSEGLIIFKSEEGYIFKVNQNKNLTLIGNSENVQLIFEGNSINQNCPLIENSGILQTKYVTFRNSINTQNGGAINNLNSGKLYIYNSLFENNKAQNGGSIYNSGEITISNCKIENNIATSNGAGLSNSAGAITTIINSEILNNNAKLDGGGIYVYGQSIIKNTIIKNNIALRNGGGIYKNSYYTTSLTCEENTIINNNTAINGGGIYIENGEVYYYSLSIYDNKVSSLGSNTYLGNRSVSLFIKSKANKLEGEIYKNKLAELYIVNETFSLYKEDKPLILNTDNDKEEVLLVGSQDYYIKKDDLKLFSSNLGTLFLSDYTVEDKYITEIKLRLKSCILTYKSGTETKEFKYHFGETVTINYNCSENQYIAKIVDDNGKAYNIEDNITIYDSLTLIVDIEEFYEITLDFIENKVKYYSPRNTYFYFPIFNNKSNGDFIITHWRDTNGSYFFDKAIINSNNMYFFANYEGYFYVKFDYEDRRIFYDLTEYNSLFTIPDLNINVPFGYHLNIEYDGNKYELGQKIFVTKNINFVVNLAKGSNLLLIIIIGASIIIIIAAICIIRKCKRERKRDTSIDEIESDILVLDPV